MRLVSFKVSDYRSIKSTEGLPILKETVLVGPNNEGKSNLLRALATSLSIVSNLDSYDYLRGGRIRRKGYAQSNYTEYSYTDYDWETDYPLALQSEKRSGESKFLLTFSLDEEEIKEFKNEVGSNLNGHLPIELTLGAQELKFKVRKKGPGAGTLSKKAKEIAKFIGQRVDFQYIPAIRTSEQAVSVVRMLVDRAMRPLQRRQDYVDVLRKLELMREDVYRSISSTIEDSLREFLPNVKSVRLDAEYSSRGIRYFDSGFQIIIDDGTATGIQRKGDGIQSLAVMSLLKYVSEKGAESKALILAIEEPEAHLHPKAVRQLKDAISSISEKNQLILATHSALFVNRMSVESNILVTKERVRVAKKLSDVREILGVLASDNLRDVELVLLVEGESDKTAIEALLACKSPKIKEAMDKSRFAVEGLFGGANLAHRLSNLRSNAYGVHCFLDNDQAGWAAIEKATRENLISISDYHLCTVGGRKESEIEDIYDPTVYEGYFESEYGVRFDGLRKKPSKREKWSARMRKVFEAQGKDWRLLERHAKEGIARIVKESPEKAIHQNSSALLDSLIHSVEQKLSTSSASGKRVRPSQPSK